MSEKIIIKKASIEDAEAILKLQKKGFLAEARLYDDFTIPPLHQTMESFLMEMSSGIVLKAVVGNEIVGTVRAHSKGETCHIAKLVVDSHYRNKGIAQSLMYAIESDFKGVKRFELFTGFKSEKNLYLYKKLGYSEFNREIIRENVTLIFMEKKNDRTIPVHRSE